jgi:hypothetical protein
MNLVSMAMNFITPAIVGRLASALGVDSRIAQMAISAALPTILATIAGKASKPEGLSQLTNILGQQDPGLLANIGSMIGGTDQGKLVTTGTNLLGSLVGNSALGTLAGAVGKFSGMGEGPAKALLGMVAPVATGTLAQQQKAAGLDASGLAKLLDAQKQNIASAVPAGFGDLLKGTGLLDSLPGFAAPAAAMAAPAAVERPRETPANTPSTPPSSGMSMLKWGAALAAVLFAFYLLGPGSGRQVSAPPTRVIHNNIDVAAQMGTLYGTLRDQVTSLRDPASATAALPKLQDASRQLEALQTLSGQMTPATRSDFARVVASYLPALRGLIETALKAAGVPAIAKPVLDQILNRMEAMAKA